MAMSAREIRSTRIDLSMRWRGKRRAKLSRDPRPASRGAVPPDLVKIFKAMKLGFGRRSVLTPRYVAAATSHGDRITARKCVFDAEVEHLVVRGPVPQGLLVVGRAGVKTLCHAPGGQLTCLPDFGLGSGSVDRGGELRSAWHCAIYVMRGRVAMIDATAHCPAFSLMAGSQLLLLHAPSDRCPGGRMIQSSHWYSKSDTPLAHPAGPSRQKDQGQQRAPCSSSQ